MRSAWGSRFRIVALFGVIVLSMSLVLMADRTIAAPPTKSGSSATSSHNWDENLPSTSRFTALAAFGGAAVRDNNTGLVWEHAPDTTLFNHTSATIHCANKTVGGTVGWRLPSVIELKSVQDPSLPAPFVPASVFTGVQSAIYWSATTFAYDPTNAWFVFFFGDSVVGPDTKTEPRYAWCVRGPMQESVY